MNLIIWDLDGTLVDSLPATLDALNDAIEPFIGRRYSPPEIIAHFGIPEERILENIVGKERAIDSYSRYIASIEGHLQKVRFFSGIADTLERLQRLKYTFAIFTARGRRTTDIIIDSLSLRSRFAEIITANEVLETKPNPEGILKICQTMGATLEKTYMIGDSPHDMNAAKRAGVHSIGCLWDTRATRQALEGANATFVAEQPDQIEKFLLNRDR